MGNKVFKQAFAKDFTGIDGLSAPIEADAEGVNRAVNLEYAVGNSLRGRVGSQSIGANGFHAMFPYSYTRIKDQYDITYGASTIGTTKTAADGASISRLIGMNQQLWVLDTMNIVVTRVSGTYPFTWYTTVSGANINFVIKANGISILNSSVGDGINNIVSIYSLLGTIDALAELSVARTTRGTCPPFAIVNGNQSSVVGATAGYGLRYTITVDAGHNFFAGDIISFPATSALSTIHGGIVLSTTATTIVYVGANVTLLDNDVVGYLAQSASSFNISTAATAASGNLTLSFPYWRLIPEGDAKDAVPAYGEFLTSSRSLWSNRTTNSFYTPPNAVNAGNTLYITAASEQSAGVTLYATTSVYSSNYQNNLIKVDGLTAVRAGVFTSQLTTAATGVGALVGTYQYKAVVRRYDAQGNIIEGTPSLAVSQVYATQYGTITATYQERVQLSGVAINYGKSGFFERCAYKNTTESPAANVSFLIDDSGTLPGNIQPGDPVILTSTVVQTTGAWITGSFGSNAIGTIRRTACTFLNGASIPNSIKVADSDGYSIRDNSVISTGLTITFFRTVAGGNTFYQVVEIPISGYTTTTSFLDNVTDTVLSTKAQLEIVSLGKEHDPPPQCSVVCQHQGSLIVARGPYSPNSVGFSSADGIEYFPLASNSVEVPSSYEGLITGIASDTADRLAVFKERSYFDLAGDLDGGAFSVNVVHEGDYGITSHASIQRVQNKLIGLSKNGFVIIHDGALDSFSLSGLNTRLINQTYQFAWATAENDAFNRAYICSIPTSAGGTEPVTFVLDYSRETLHTFERSYTTQIDPAGGQVSLADNFYHLSQTSPYTVFKRLPRFQSNSPGVGDGDSYIDNTNAINYILESHPINFGEPGQLKTPIRTRIWSMPNDYVVDGWVTFSSLVETACSAIASYIGGTSPGSASSTITFSTANDSFKDIKLPNYKTHFYLIRFTTNTIRTAPFITGYEIMFVENYDKEDFVK